MRTALCAVPPLACNWSPGCACSPNPTDRWSWRRRAANVPSPPSRGGTARRCRCRAGEPPGGDPPGADPTKLFGETAAGNAGAGTTGGVVGSSAGGFVVVDLNSEYTLAEAGLTPAMRRVSRATSCSMPKIRICWQPSPSQSPRPTTTSSMPTRRPASSFAALSRTWKSARPSPSP